MAVAFSNSKQRDIANIFCNIFFKESASEKRF